MPHISVIYWLNELFMSHNRCFAGYFQVNNCKHPLKQYRAKLEVFRHIIV